MEIRFFAPGSLVSNLDFVEGIFGNARRSVSAGKRRRARRDALDRPHRLRDRGAASGGNQEEGSGPAAREGRHRAPAPRRNVLARSGRALQRRRLVQGRLPRRARRDGHDHRRQLLRLLQKGSEDADQLRRQSLRPVRRGARRRRHRFCHLRAGPGFSRGQRGQPEKGRVSATPCDLLGPLVEATAGRLRGRPALSGYSVRAGGFRVQRARGHRCNGSTTERRAASDASRRHHLRASQRLPPAHGKAIGRLGVAAGRRAPARHAVPQALHRFRRRQIGNLEIDRQRDPRRARFRRRLSPRRRAGGRNPEEGFFGDLQEPPSRRARAAPDPEPRAHDGLGDPAFHAVARIHGRAQRLDCARCPTPFASCCSP